MKENQSKLKSGDDKKKYQKRNFNDEQWKVITAIFGTILVFKI